MLRASARHSPVAVARVAVVLKNKLSIVALTPSIDSFNSLRRFFWLMQSFISSHSFSLAVYIFTFAVSSCLCNTSLNTSISFFKSKLSPLGRNVGAVPTASKILHNVNNIKSFEVISIGL